jgi:glycosyltransferase involved in cell wall biosynthesis
LQIARFGRDALMPKISVIIPVYNSEKYLDKCVDSVLAQTFTDFECILINDGSCDDSGSICDERSKRDGRVKVIHQRNRGVSAARNAGLDAALGEWITFVDSDDWVDENYLELMYGNAANNGCELSVCGRRLYSENGELLDVSKRFPVIFFDKVLAKRALFGFEYFTTVAWGKLVNRRSVYDGGVRFDTAISVCEDGLFWFEVIDKVETVLYDSTPCYNYLMNMNSLVNSPKAADDYMTVFAATEKMARTETNAGVFRKIRSYEALVASRWCGILLGRGEFDRKRYRFYRARLLKSLFYHIVDGGAGIRSKAAAILRLFPWIYRRLKRRGVA